MKLKFAIPLVALSVASSVAFAAAYQAGPMPSKSKPLPPKPHAMANTDYFMGIDNNSVIVPGTYDPASPAVISALKGGNNWMRHIRIGLLNNVQGFYQSDFRYLKPDYTAGDQTGVSVNGRLNVDAYANPWVKGHISLEYATLPTDANVNNTHGGIAGQPFGINGGYGSRLYATTLAGKIADIDEAYITIGNPRRVPIMGRVGKQYVGFGKYNLNALMPSLTQQMTETRAEALQAGYYGHLSSIAGGFRIQGFVFNGLNSGSIQGNQFVSDNTNSTRDFGGAVAYQRHAGAVHFDLDASYLNNLNDVGIFAATPAQPYGSNGYKRGYVDDVPAVSFDADAYYGQFGFNAHYVMATKSFNQSDFKFDNGNAEPDAGTIGASYRFPLSHHNSQATLSYQWSDQAQLAPTASGNNLNITGGSVSLPKDRIAGQYNIALFPKTNLGIEVNYDEAYSTSNYGSGQNSVAVLTNLSVLLG